MNKKVISKIIGIAAALAVIVAAFTFTAKYIQSTRITSIVSLDVNPSIELSVNGKDDVVKANAVTQDAENLIRGIRLEGEDIDDAIESLLTAMVRQGYITSDSNAVLLSVDGDEKLGVYLCEKIKNTLSENGINASVITLLITPSEEIVRFAEENKISKAKAELINKIVSLNKGYSMLELVPLNINELNMLTESSGQHESITLSGVSSTVNYITRDEAVAIALRDAEKTESDIYALETDFDYERGLLTWSVEFDSGNREYSYEVDASNGNILEREKEFD